MASSNFDKIVSLAKRRGFFYPSCDVYGGLNGVYDKGHLGVLLERQVTDFWRSCMRSSGYDMVLMDGSLLGNEQLWKASGHIDNFHDPLVDCKACKARFRADAISTEKSCERCGKKDWSEVRQFNMMFKTSLGASVESSSDVYLRPETAQNIFVQFKNIFSTSRVKIPFGVMQIGKAFRNEITPRQFLFRVREFSQMEMELFCTPDQGFKLHEEWINRRLEFYRLLGMSEMVRLHHHDESERAHYSKGTTDVEFNFPFGWRELEGIAYRGDFDLSQHMKHSNKDFSVFEESTKASYVPHVVECSVGVERLMLALLCAGYTEEELPGGDIRTVLKLPAFIAPIKVAILPLTKNEEELAGKIYKELDCLGLSCQYDATGSIGKRYRRYDEIGTPFCVTIDMNSVQTESVTVRMRDSMAQEIVSLKDLTAKLLSLTARPC